MAALAVSLVLGATHARAAEEGWSGELNLAFAAQTGTKDTTSGTLDAKTTRTWENDVVAIRFRGDYGTSREKDGGTSTADTTQDSQAFFVDWKHHIHERFFWDTKTEASRDNTQDRELRASLSMGPGYRFWQAEEASKRHFDTNTGIGYRYEIYDGNTGAGAAANGYTDQFVDLVVGFEYKNLFFDDRMEWSHTGVAFVPANDFAAYLLRTEVIIGLPLTESWSFRTSFLAEYTADVAARVNKTKTVTSIGLGYTF